MEPVSVSEMDRGEDGGAPLHWSSRERWWLGLVGASKSMGHRVAGRIGIGTVLALAWRRVGRFLSRGRGGARDPRFSYGLWSGAAEMCLFLFVRSDEKWKAFAL